MSKPGGREGRAIGYSLHRNRPPAWVLLAVRRHRLFCEEVLATDGVDLVPEVGARDGVRGGAGAIAGQAFLALATALGVHLVLAALVVLEDLAVARVFPARHVGALVAEDIRGFGLLGLAGAGGDQEGE